MKTKEKDLNYWKNNAEEDYIKTPISVLRYISELEKVVNKTVLLPDVMLRFKLRLNIETWGSYKKGDEDYFNIKLLDEQN